MEKKQVVCFGEVLWDDLPSGRKPGGAPMNVAYHLNILGVQAAMISRVGNDPDGKELLSFLNRMGLTTGFCQIDQEQPTSVTKAVITTDHEVSYEIPYPTSWDFIVFDQQFNHLMPQTDAIVFGSLSARNDVTRNTLYRLLESPVFKVFDINLRQPFYSPKSLSEQLYRADLLKLNEKELQILAGMYLQGFNDEADTVRRLQEMFAINEILLTRGSAGASWYSTSSRYTIPAYKVVVNDTVGSGDSFLAGFLAKRLQNDPIPVAMNYASALAAFITSYPGACPPYSLAAFEAFMARADALTGVQLTGQPGR